MRRLLVRWLIASVALLVTIRLVPGLEMAGAWWGVLLAALVLGLLNVCARPVVWLIKVLTMPLSCLTFGLWNFVLALVVNGLIFYLVGSRGWGLRVDGFLPALVGAAVMGALSAIINGLFGFVTRRN